MSRYAVWHLLENVNSDSNINPCL
uniref:Uncharacterized protein n=1 Tax=Triticum urartu TaxID=4572 RepID=A0A8R7NYV8_TRIUA